MGNVHGYACTQPPLLLFFFLTHTATPLLLQARTHLQALHAHQPKMSKPSRCAKSAQRTRCNKMRKKRKKGSKPAVADGWGLPLISLAPSAVRLLPPEEGKKHADMWGTATAGIKPGLPLCPSSPLLRAPSPRFFSPIACFSRFVPFLLPHFLNISRVLLHFRLIWGAIVADLPEMAAVARVPRAGRGGPGRAQGQQRPPAAAVVEAAPVPIPAAPQVDDPIAPPNLRWTLTWKDDAGLDKNKGDQAVKMYRFLWKSLLVDKMELANFGVSEAILAAQPPGVDRLLAAVVDMLNMLMPVRQRYLYKKIKGEWGKEMNDMQKKLMKYVDRIDEKIEAIRDAGGFCPHRPKLFDSIPQQLKK